MRVSAGFRPGLLIAAAIIGIDQLVKWWVVTIVMQPPHVIEVTSFFNLVMVWNRGVSFGLFNGNYTMNGWLLPLVALIIVSLVLFWLSRTDRLFPAVSYGLIIGGAIGNVIDRFRFGAVADFLDFHAMAYHWPAFNVADSAVTIGACLLVYDSFFSPAKRPREEDAMRSEQ